MGTTVMTADEAKHLMTIVKMRARTARADVASRSSALLSDFERAMQAELGPQEQELSALTSEAEVHLAKINSMLRDKCTDAGIPLAWAPLFSVSFPAREAPLMAKRRADMRKLASARLEAMRRQALLEIERHEASMLTELLSTRLFSEPALEWLERMPTAEALLPAFSYSAVAALSAAELVPK